MSLHSAMNATIGLDLLINNGNTKCMHAASIHGYAPLSVTMYSENTLIIASE